MDIKPDNIVFKNNAVVTVRELDPENGFKPKVLQRIVFQKRSVAAADMVPESFSVD